MKEKNEAKDRDRMERSTFLPIGFLSGVSRITGCHTGLPKFCVDAHRSKQERNRQRHIKCDKETQRNINML